MDSSLEQMTRIENFSRINFGILAHNPGYDKIHLIYEYLQNFKTLDVFADSDLVQPSTTVIFVSISTILQWKNEADKWPGLKIGLVSTVRAFRSFRQNLMGRFDVVLVSFELAYIFFSWARTEDQYWRRIIFDSIESFLFVSEMDLPQAQFYWFVAFGNRVTLACYINLFCCRTPIANYLQHYDAQIIDKVIVERKTREPTAATLYSHLSNKLPNLGPTYQELAVMSSSRAETFVSTLQIDSMEVDQVDGERRDHYRQEGCSICLTVAKLTCCTGCCRNLICLSCLLTIEKKRNPCPFCRGKDLKKRVKFVPHFPNKWLDICSIPQILDAVAPGRSILIVYSLGESVVRIENSPNVDVFSGCAEQRWDKICKFNDATRAEPYVLAGFVRDFMGVVFEAISDLVLVGQFEDYTRFICDATPTRVHLMS